MRWPCTWAGFYSLRGPAVFLEILMKWFKWTKNVLFKSCHLSYSFTKQSDRNIFNTIFSWKGNSVTTLFQLTRPYRLLSPFQPYLWWYCSTQKRLKLKLPGAKYTQQKLHNYTSHKKSHCGSPSVLLFGVLSDVHLLVSPLVREVAAAELGDRPEPGQAHQSEGQEGHSHG